jgi:predicted GH43/DUF377 family glycosyl hydrolase
MVTNFAKIALEAGGLIKPLIIPSELTDGTGLCNPSVFNLDGKIVLNLRHVQYNLYHSEIGQKYPSWHGPLIYLHPEDDVTLRTENYFCLLSNTLEIDKFMKIDMSTFNVPPKWEFIGLEDCRLFKWDNRLYVCGVRRDTTTNGQGRMELSEIKVTANAVTEISRSRINPPGDKSYCEKNWMPILDMPYHFVKWTNPTEVVKSNPATGDSETVILTEGRQPLPRDLRGGSQVIPFEGGYIALTHEVDLWNGEAGHKDAHYYQRFVIWDKDFNLVKWSQEFKFMEARIEFAAGMALKGKDFLITYGYQDNAAYILRVPVQTVKDFIDGKFNS